MPITPRGHRALSTSERLLAIQTATGHRPTGCRSRPISPTSAGMRPTSRREEGSHSPFSTRATATLLSAASTCTQRRPRIMTSLSSHGCEQIGQTSMPRLPTQSPTGSRPSGHGSVWIAAVADRSVSSPSCALPPFRTARPGCATYRRLAGGVPLGFGMRGGTVQGDSPTRQPSLGPRRLADSVVAVMTNWQRWVGGAVAVVLVAACSPSGGSSGPRPPGAAVTVPPAISTTTTIPGIQTSGTRTVLSPIGLNVRDQPAATGRVLGVAGQGAALAVIGYTPAGGGWYHVHGATVTGWISARTDTVRPRLLPAHTTRPRSTSTRCTPPPGR